MRKVPLGRSGLEVSRLGFGCMGLAEFYGDALSNKAAEALLDAVLARGVNFLDTADMYGAGRNGMHRVGFSQRIGADFG